MGFVSVYFVQIKFMQIVAQSLIPVRWRAMFEPVTAAAAAPHPSQTPVARVLSWAPHFTVSYRLSCQPLAEKILVALDWN